MTRSEIRSDIELRLTKGKPSDDMELEPRQINFWIDIVRAKLIKDKILAEGYNADLGTSSATWIPALEINQESISEALDAHNQSKYYISIPGQIMSLPKDMAIVSVSTLSGDQVNRIRFTDLGAMSSIKHMKPSPSNMVFYRIGTKLYILGPSEDFLANGYLNVFVILSKTNSIDDSDEFPIPEDLLPILLDAVEAIARRQFQLPQDLLNDGVS